MSSNITTASAEYQFQHQYAPYSVATHLPHPSGYSVMSYLDSIECHKKRQRVALGLPPSTLYNALHVPTQSDISGQPAATFQ